MIDKNGTKKRLFILGLCAITIVLVSTLGTYAYFMTNLGREEKQELTVTTGTLALVFEDNSDGINATLSLGESVTKEFKIRNTGTQEVTTNMLFSEMTNTYMEESLSYRLEYKTSVDGEWTNVETASSNVPQSRKATEKNLAENLTIPAGETYYYRLTITFNDLDINQNDDIDAIFASKFKIGEAITPSKEILDYLEIALNNKKFDFANPAPTDEGVLALNDDYGTSYYYRGAVTNNYVKFGDFYWRIIRINGDGSLRIIYDGAQGYANGTSSSDRFTHTNVIFNNHFNDNKYTGWMFGGAQGASSTSKEQAKINETDSYIKTVVDSWYKTNIVDKNLGEKIADVIFCNDRTTPGKEATGFTNDTGLGYGMNHTAYGATARLGGPWQTEVTQPTFICPEKNDAFTVSDEEKGNGALTYPVGLITADEIVAAGSGKYGTENSSYYLNKGNWYWSMTSFSFINEYANIFRVTPSGSLHEHAVTTPGGSIAPVINLKSEYVQTMIGTGSLDNPYRDATSSI